jgi:UDPglucose 6-dehydrogenase
MQRTDQYLSVYDPEAMGNVRAVLPESETVAYARCTHATADGCDALVIATGWPTFTKHGLPRVLKAIATPIVFEGRNLLDPAEIE